MTIALIGATSLVGSKILAAGLDRGHAITAIVRNPDALPEADAERVAALGGPIAFEADPGEADPAPALHPDPAEGGP